MKSAIDTLLNWYRESHRTLPWRDCGNPYYIWISEIILQQTQIKQGTDYYLRFIDRFPTVRHLAEASEEEVLQAWQGLGYYSRARHLHAAAQSLVARFGGEIPAAYASIRSLPGIGDYTAAAIASMAFHLPYPAIDGNHFRVMSRVYGISDAVDTPQGRKTFQALEEKLIQGTDPALFNQALMDFGALICTPTPRCSICPLQEVCKGREEARMLPVKIRKTAVKDLTLNWLRLQAPTRTLIHKRTEAGIWRNLYDFMLLTAAEPLTEEGVINEAEARLSGDLSRCRMETRLLPKHQLTHRTIFATLYTLYLPDETYTVPEGFIWVKRDELSAYPHPKLLAPYFKG